MRSILHQTPALTLPFVGRVAKLGRGSALAQLGRGYARPLRLRARHYPPPSFARRERAKLRYLPRKGGGGSACVSSIQDNKHNGGDIHA